MTDKPQTTKRKNNDLLDKGIISVESTEDVPTAVELVKNRFNTGENKFSFVFINNDKTLAGTLVFTEREVDLNKEDIDSFIKYKVLWLCARGIEIVRPDATR